MNRPGSDIGLVAPPTCVRNAVPVFYVNLDRQPERRRSIEDQVEAWHVAAVDGEASTGRGETDGYPYAELSPEEMGCFGPHGLVEEYDDPSHIGLPDPSRQPHAPTICRIGSDAQRGVMPYRALVDERTRGGEPMTQRNTSRGAP